MSFQIANIPPVHFGPGKISEIPRICAQFGKKVLWITGANSLKSNGKWAILAEKLNREGLEIIPLIIDSEPSALFVDETCLALRDQGIDVVLGVGGGSVIDGAKAISAMLLQQNSVFDHLEDVGRGIPHNGKKIPFIAVPTTSGTGGEMTKNAVLSKVGPQGYKKSLRHENLIPNAVVIDPELMVTCPTKVTAACGMDAFTQLVESYLSPIASPFTDILALNGMTLLIQNLGLACGQESANLEVRSHIAYASMLSGICLANAGLGIVHGLASPLGGFFAIPHGVVCGTLLGAATEMNIRALQARGGNDSTVALAKYRKIGQLFAGENRSPSESQQLAAFVEQIQSWIEQLQLPRLGNYGIQPGDLGRVVEKTSNRHNPIALTQAEMMEILACRL